MFNVAGGTYLEYCRDPGWSQLFGSGLRAAVACSSLSRKVCLHTYVSDAIAEDLNAYLASFPVQVKTADSPFPIAFHYTQPLAAPRIIPRPDSAFQQEPIKVSGESVLRFGMLEGTAQVDGNRVTFDPQNVESPENYFDNGSTAKTLALVLNAREAFKLSGERSPTRAGRLIVKHFADIAVIKDGPRGAHVFDRGRYTHVTSFQTQRVWPIGSGDVFAGLFGHFWGEKKLKPEQAAIRASWGTASFVLTRALPISSAVIRATPRRKSSSLYPQKSGGVRAYLAGPFFTMAQRWLINEARDALRGMGLSVFSPFHDVGIGPASVVVPQDLGELERADVVLALADGTDSGTMFEIGYARKLGKPVVVLAEHEGEQPLKMIRGSDCIVTPDFATAIYNTWWAGAGKYAPPSYSQD